MRAFFNRTSAPGIPHQNGNTVDYFMADIRQCTDYSGFGVQLQERNLSLSGNGVKLYRYGFQNQEFDSETGLVNYKYRMQNPRLGRFFAIDPLEKDYPWNSPYAFSENRLLDAIELEGLEAFFIHGTSSSNQRWEGKKGLKLVNTLMQITNNKTKNTKFDWSAKWYGFGTSFLLNDENDRRIAAKRLVNHIMKNKVEGEEVTLIGHSHGVNVSIQAARMLYEEHGIKVNIISVAAPAFNSDFDVNSDNSFFGDAEDPQGNPGINDMIHIWNPQDGVSGGFVGDDTYDKSSGVENIKIDVRINDSDIGSHSFDYEKPELIQKKIDNGKIDKMDKVDKKYIDGNK